MVLLAAGFLLPGGAARGAGARLFKSGPIQITADGRHVWVANDDNDSVTRIDSDTGIATEVVLPDTGLRHAPRGLSVLEDGSEIWVACHDSDRIYILDGSGAASTGRVDLPWGSGPWSVAISPDQTTVLATLHRGEAIAVLDRASRSIVRILEPVYLSPLGIAWTEGGRAAWITHLFADGEDPFLTRVDLSGAEPRVTSRIIVKSTNPKQSSKLSAPHNVAEGGYLTFRGHLAQIPAASGRNEVWLPTQYNNINEDVFTPDSTVQTTIRRLDLATRKIPNTNADKVILTAIHVHDPQAGGSPYVGPGWDARISGPVDIAFSTDGGTAYVLNEQSNDLLVLPSSTPASRPAGDAPLLEIPVGDRPVGLAVSPVSETAYVANSLSRDVSVVDLSTGAEIRRIPVTPSTGERLAPSILRGAKLFHSSTDPRLSGNNKVACASCHPHGEHDGRIWDFEHLPGRHGPRSSMSLLGLSLTLGPPDPSTGWGQLHRSGDRDEIQDFDHSARSGLMGGSGFLGASPPAELGPSSSGLDADLDAIADYLTSLEPIRRSPHREADGSLSEAAVRGATFFMGSNRAAKPADAGCGSCHVPETGFVDFRFHDVGQRRAGSEKELGARSPAWHVNTATLIGVWNTPPYDGVSGYSSTILGVLKDQAARARSSTPHGKSDGLTRRQLDDLARFVLSIDGDMTGAEVRGARDTTPPRLIRAEPASLTTLVVWFSETVEAAGARDPASWRVEKTGGDLVPVSAAVHDAQNGDRVTLTAAFEAGDPPIEYRVLPAGPIRDAAASASGGAANTIDLGDPSNTRTFTIGPTLTVTLGASGREHLTVKVHDAGMVGPSLDTWSHDSPWLFTVSGGGRNTGFVRFEWVPAFQAATGLTDPARILDAGFSLVPEWGDAQPIELRRALKPWSDPASGGDWNSNPTGGPTWRSHSHPSGAWTRSGAGALGGTGADPADYNGSFDLAATVDAVVPMETINERVLFGGPAVTEAFRFWFENPALDNGYGLRLAAGAIQEAKFERAESELGEHGPILRITYALPVAGPSGPFHRGDPNASGAIDITDAIFIFNYLFLAGAEPGCLESADAQNDGTVDISDGVSILMFLFLAGSSPAEPGPPDLPCGPDPDAAGSPGDLGCAEYSGC